MPKGKGILRKTVTTTNPKKSTYKAYGHFEKTGKGLSTVTKSATKVEKIRKRAKALKKEQEEVKKSRQYNVHKAKYKEI